MGVPLIENGYANVARIEPYLASGMVREFKHDGFPELAGFCYTPMAQYSRTWDEITTACRGLVVVRDTGLVIGRSLPKFGNYGDPMFPVPETVGWEYSVTEKSDGSLINVGEYNGEMLIWTKGSFNTDHSAEALKYLDGFRPVLGSTALFEGVFGFNRVVVDYGSFRGLIMLGMVDNINGYDSWQPYEAAHLSGWPGEVAANIEGIGLHGLVRVCSDPENGENREGFVIMWPSEDGPATRLKIKFKRYVDLHGLMTNTTGRRVHEAMLDDTLEDFLEQAPDELYADVLRVSTAYAAEASETVDRAREYVAKFTDRAVAAASHEGAPAHLRGIVWKLYDGKDDQAFMSALRMVKSEALPLNLC